MKKKILAGIIAALALGTVTAMAAPQPLEEGGVTIMKGYNISPDAEAGKTDYDGKSGFYGNITYGMGNNWGIQYDYSHGEYKGNSFKAKTDASEVNLLYRLDEYTNVYAGYTYIGLSEPRGGASGSGIQVGLQAHYPFSDKFIGFGKLGLGTASSIYELGVSYVLSERWDLDVSYRYADYEDVRGSADITYDGIRLGITTKY